MDPCLSFVLLTPLTGGLEIKANLGLKSVFRLHLPTGSLNEKPDRELSPSR